MAHIIKFEIENFKGIKKLSLDVSTRGYCPIITLVGLNESGKTTILEALSHFTTSEGTISESNPRSDSTDAFALVPISQKEYFTGEIKISATIRVEDADKEEIEKIFKTGHLFVDDKRIPREFEISITYRLEDGNFSGPPSNLWDLRFYVKKTRKAKSYRRYMRPDSEEKNNGTPDLWSECVRSLRKSLPSIAYFPTFLVDIPDRIYLDRYDDEPPQQKYYREVLQDVLDRRSEGIEISTHIVERIAAFFENGGDEETFPDSNEYRQVQSAISKIQSSINQKVIGSWKNISKRDVSTLSVVLEWNKDSEKNNIPYVRFSILEGESNFTLRERSLGFQWFFLFLLFTRFKRDENKPTMFLFDEPAANLHARAQQALLESFNKIVENENKIIYSTHSAYMINPRWLSCAYIVENEAIDYEATDDPYNVSSTPASISILVTPYRQFVGSYPKRSSYFQPILEKLDHVSSALEPGGRVLLTEGISDFHALSFYCDEMLREHSISVLPGCGAEGLDTQISILHRQGARFIVVLDDDIVGQQAAKKYREKWLLDERRVATIGELLDEAKSKKLETLLSDETRDVIAKHFNTSVKNLSKKQIGLYFAEANAWQTHEKKSAATERLMQSIVEGAVSRILSQTEEGE